MADKEKWSDGTAKDFNARFFRSVEGKPWTIRWYDQMGIVQLGKTLAEIRLAEGDVYKGFSGYLVSLRSKTKGEIARHYFQFDNHLGGKYLVTTNNPWGRFEWVAPGPLDEAVDEMASEIMSYISEYGT